MRPFRADTTLAFGVNVVENRLHPSRTDKIDISMAGLSIPASVEPVPLGEIWFRTIKDRATDITVDDEQVLNRASAIVESGSGEFVLPFIPARPTQVAVRDFQVKGLVQLEGRVSSTLDEQVTITLVDADGVELVSPLNDEDRFQQGIQHTLRPDGSFALTQIPAGQYRVFLKPRSHLQGQVSTDTVTIGSTSSTLAFQWLRSDSTLSATLAAGDATDDNRVNLADYGVFVRYVDVSSANQLLWPEARAVDFNGDQVVNTLDFFLFAQNFGETGQTIFPAPAAKTRARTTGVIFADKNSRALRVEGLGSIAGFALHFVAGEGDPPSSPAVNAGPSETVFYGVDLIVHHWSNGGVHRVMAALRDPAASVEGDGILMVLDDAMSGHVTLIEADVLLANGSVVSPLLSSSTSSPSPKLPTSSQLMQNYPNPFNPTTTIPYVVSVEHVSARVRLDIYDLLGQRIRTLVDDAVGAGHHRVEWNGRDGSDRPVASGMYLYSLKISSVGEGESTGSSITKRLLLVR